MNQYTKFWQTIRKNRKQFEKTQKTYFCDERQIRHKSGDCPICFVCRTLTGISYLNSDFDKAAADLGLSHEFACEFINAADFLKGKHSKKLLEVLK